MAKKQDIKQINLQLKVSIHIINEIKFIINREEYSCNVTFTYMKPYTSY